MKRSLFAAAVLGLFTVACEAPTALTEDQSPQFTRGGGGVVLQVSVGGADICDALGQKTGCDANFSLQAKQFADGSVSGQWQDTFAGGGKGVHVAIDCLEVSGNRAALSGVVTHGTTNGGVDVTGLRALTVIADNGTSQSDPADQISFTQIEWPFGNDCHDAIIGVDLGLFDGILFDLVHGQVKVR